MKKKILIICSFIMLFLCGNNFNSIAKIEQQGPKINQKSNSTSNIERRLIADLSMEKYFINLYDNSPKNTVGTCGFVSLIQYLTYLDTFYNDSIVEGIFEQLGPVQTTLNLTTNVSPGVKNNNIPDGEDLRPFINNNKNYDLQCLLIDNYNTMIVTGENENYKLDLGMWNYQELLEYSNFSSFLNFIYEQAEKDEFDSSAKIQYMKSKATTLINSGVPVILHIAKGIDANNNYIDYHSVVAYDVGNSGIWANFGWDSEDTYNLVEDYYITEIGYFNLDLIPHLHSDNYRVKYKDYCGCGYNEHRHYYDYSYDYIDYKYHNSLCSCQDVRKDGHVVRSGSFANGEKYVNCLLCGGLAEVGFIAMQDSTISNIKILTSNGSYLRADGIIVLSESDYELFVEGELNIETLIGGYKQ